jgi:hypothetical protein
MLLGKPDYRQFFNRRPEVKDLRNPEHSGTVMTIGLKGTEVSRHCADIMGNKHAVLVGTGRSGWFAG